MDETSLQLVGGTEERCYGATICIRSAESKVPCADEIAVLYIDDQTEDCLSCRTNAYPETPTPLKWDFYKQNVQKAEFVENFRKQVRLTVAFRFVYKWADGVRVYVYTHVLRYVGGGVYVYIHDRSGQSD